MSIEGADYRRVRRLGNIKIAIEYYSPESYGGNGKHGFTIVDENRGNAIHFDLSNILRKAGYKVVESWEKRFQ